MRVVDLFDQVRDGWAQRVIRRLARGESFQEVLNRYFDLMRQAISGGDPIGLNEILDEWAAVQTQAGHEHGEASLLPILGQTLLSLHDATKEHLGSEEAVELIGAILPLHTHAVQYTSQRDVEISGQHIADELEQARAALERLDASKSGFISVAAHELRTPLTLLEGYSSMLSDILQAEDQVRERVEIMLKGIENGIHRLGEIIDDMVDVSLIDNDMLNLTYQPVWIHQLLGIVRQEIDKTIAERSLNLTIEEFPGHDEMTFGDPERLYQAIWNVLSNAVKYTPDGGAITVSGRRLPGFVEMAVQDSGIGISPQDQLNIFEKFGQLGDVSLHSSGKTKYKGSGPGLGLPIAKGIIEAHGGAIWVESEGYDEVACPGSTFHILLPIRKESPDDKVNQLFKPMSKGGSAPGVRTYEEVKEAIAKETSWPKG